MEKLTKDSPETRSLDVVAENIAQLKALFPDSTTEGRIDFEVLKQLLGSEVEEREERFGLNWHGKRQARQLALASSVGTLRPSKEESFDWDSTRNLMIEGDNLEVIKLLQKSYAGKVKLIYIDPPYNTGEDFVYPDDMIDNVRNYQQITGQIEGGRKIGSNTEAGGRFHTDWLNMVYPRLRIARNLLRKDGVIFISIDDQEVANLRSICDEIFGIENFIAQMVWEGANKNDAKQVGICHEYVLIYARNREFVPREWGLKKDGVDAVLKEVERLRSVHGDDFEAASDALAGWYRAMKASESFAHRRYKFIDKRGAFKEENPTAPGGRKFQLIDPRNGNKIRLRPNRGWAFDQNQFNTLVDEDRIRFVTESSIMLKLYLHETDSMTPPSVFYQPARSASERLGKLMEDDVFDFPKDELILMKFIEMATSPTDKDCIIMDFFAGSGTTGHAVMAQNAADGGTRTYILVQLPEVLSHEKANQEKAAYFCDKINKPRTIAELTKERLRRASAKIKTDIPTFSGDVGFRVFKFDSSNLRPWEAEANNLPQTLMDAVEHIKEGRTEQDLLFELLLKLGLDLTVPMEQKTIAGKTVHSIGAGVLMVCLDEAIAKADYEALGNGIVAWHRELAPTGETTLVFRDSAFADDVVKTNLTAILSQGGLDNVRSL